MRGAGCPRVTQPFATLYTPEGVLTVRLACVRRAASVHPEPGSNSRFESPPGPPGEDSMEEVRARPNPADLDSLGIELTFENFISNFAHSLSFVDLSIAVSGFQGSPPWASARGAGINYTHPGGPRGRGGDPPPIPHIPLPARAGAPETRGGGGPRTSPSCRMPVAGRRRPALPRACPAVPSALGGLTSGFGMGPGVPPLPWPPTSVGRSIPGAAEPCPGGRTARQDASLTMKSAPIRPMWGKEELGRLVPLA